MRSLKLILSVAALAFLDSTSHAAVRVQATSHQHTLTAHQTTITIQAPALMHHRVLFGPVDRLLPGTVNPPTRTTVFSYLVNLIRGFFSHPA